MALPRISLTVEQELRRTFELATLRREARHIETPRQWAQVIEMQLRCDMLRSKAEHLHTTRYDTRVEAARRRLIDEAAGRGPHPRPRWAGNDRFNPQETLRQAQRDVRHAHEQRMERIDDIERRQLDTLVRQSRRENRLQDMARGAFNQSADRRNGVERRRVRPREH